MNEPEDTSKPTLPHLPDAETILAELSKARSVNDLTGKDGVFARLFGKTLSAMLEGEMSAHLGYEPYEAKGRNSGNSRNGKRQRTVNTAVYLVMGGKKDVLGHWVGHGGEGSSFWLNVITELKNRGVQEVFIACVDGLSGFE